MNFREFADPLRHNDAQDEQDINWLGIDPHVKPPEPKEKWYRGQWHDTSRIGHPTISPNPRKSDGPPEKPAAAYIGV